MVSFFNTLFGKLKTKPEPAAETPIDLSRVIKMPKPAQADTAVTPPPPLADTMAERAETAVEALSEHHQNWLDGDIKRLVEGWEKLKANPEIEDKARFLFIAAHDLKGMASTYGRPLIERLCTSLCQLLEECPPQENMALINLHVEACQAALLETDAASAIGQSVCVALEAQVDRRLVHQVG